MAAAGKMTNRTRARRAAPPGGPPRSRNGPGAVAPVNGRTVGKLLRILRRAARGWNAPVMALEAAEHGDPFRTLIGCILSLRTRDETTAEAVPRLFARASTPQAMLRLGAGTDPSSEHVGNVGGRQPTPRRGRRSK